ncbi:MAG TPA: hypothetical protein DE315_05355 [Candidatus Omnitrophica bacterium]|nr:hypothetical protein [Candidatus Omnitrophota bacterium]
MVKPFKCSNFEFKYCFGFRISDFVFIPRCIVLAMSFLVLAGCAKLQHLDQLLTLKAVSDEQTQMGKEIERQDARFERLVAAVEEGSIGGYKDQKSVTGQFGPPIFTETVQEDGRPLEVWVYRYAARFFDSPKVYLYWDQAGQLVRWEYK